MSGQHPRDVCFEVSSFGPGCNLAALYSAAWEGIPGHAFKEFRSASAPDEEHEARISWASPVTLRAARLRWARGCAPSAWRLFGVRPDGQQVPLQPGWVAADEECDDIALQGQWVGFKIVQKANSGGAAHPHQMRLHCFSVVPDVAGTLQVALHGEGFEPHLAAMPLLEDGDPWTFVEVGHASALEATAVTPTSFLGVDMEVLRVASVGRRDDLVAWLASVDALETLCDGQWRRRAVSSRSLDASRGGVVVGRTRLRLTLDEALSACSAVRVPLPDNRSLQMALGALTWLKAPSEPLERLVPRRARVASEPDPRFRGPDADYLGARYQAKGDYTVEAARQWTHPVSYGLSIGVPGMDGRAGVSVDGGLMMRPGPGTPHHGSNAACLHFGLGVALADGPFESLQSWSSGAIERAVSHQRPDCAVSASAHGVCVSQRLTPDPCGGDVPWLRWRVACRNVSEASVDVAVCVAMALRDHFWALPLALVCEEVGPQMVWRWPHGDVALVTHTPWEVHEPDDARQEWRMSRRASLAPGEEVAWWLDVPLGAASRAPDAAMTPEGAEARLEAQLASVLGEPVSMALPVAWGALAQRLLTQASLFIQGGRRVTYGVFPSAYAGTVFGLEEHYLFEALAMWGCGEAALESWRATYLNEAHLDKAHYLHDLRNGLTPWQLASLLSLSGRTWQDALNDDERELLTGLGRWVRAQREATAHETGELQEDGGRVFPGLLKPFRYGGDLDFHTQSLSAAVVNAVGLRALGELVEGEEGEAFARAYEEMRRCLVEAFEAIKGVDAVGGELYLLHTGGGDAGDYFQLMVPGIVEHVDFFGLDDPIACAMDQTMEGEGRLFFGLPRFDVWGSPWPGLDVHYGVGYLLRALRQGRRAVFWTGLCGMIAHAMDPAAATFREVSPLQAQAPVWGHDTMLPGRNLARSAPCVGGVGVVLQLIRHALITEMPGPDGRLTRRLKCLAGVPPSWWLAGRLCFGPAPTHGGVVRVEALVEGASQERVAVRVEAPDADNVEIVAPVRQGWSLLRTEGAASGRGRLDVTFVYQQTP